MSAYRDLNSLIEKYPAALDNPDKMRGFKRTLTLYVREQEAQGRTRSRILAGVKRSLTCAGLDTSPLLHF
jgi:hypothetical protein